MKVKSFILLSIIGLGFMLSSCAIQTPIAKMEKNYEKRMSTSEELNAKARVKVFYNEKDVPCDYSVLSLIKYKPLTMPIFMPEKGKMNKKFIKKAVLKADEIGANAIIIQGMGFAKAISAPGLKVDIAEEDVQNTLGVSYLYGQFTDGTIANLSKKEKAKLVNTFEDEIKNNIESCKTLEDVAYISRKIDALEKHLVAEGKKTSNVKSFREDLSKVEAKIVKRENRAKKVAESKAKIKEKINGFGQKAENK